MVEREAGYITQAIGASIVPIETVKRLCASLINQAKLTITIPGFLMIDTPGHAAFTTLRKRGGSIADIAILVIDINEGFKPQTLEAVDVLKTYKVPFIVAANKIDLVPGWMPAEGTLLQKFDKQSNSTVTELETRLYVLVGKLHEMGFSAERFDRIEDYTKQIAIVPCSAKNNIGIAELLMVLTGLAQRFMEQKLQADVKGNAKGTILEVKEEKGLGITLDVILYDGKLRVNDTIVIGGMEKPIVTKVRALLQPTPLAEMRDKKSKFTPVKEVHAATGVKISAPDIENVIAGMPLVSCTASQLDTVMQEIQEEVAEVLIETDKEGVIIKADTLGSLEALIVLLRGKNIPIMKASIGIPSKKDISDAESMVEKDPLKAVVLCFNVKVPEEVKAMSKNVTVLYNDVIYRLLDDYEKWKKEHEKVLESKELENITRPCKIELLRGFVFRQNNPAVVGAEILVGVAKTGMPLMKEGKQITYIKSIGLEKETVTQAEKGKKVALAMEHVMVGRQIREGDILFSAVTEDEFRKLKELKQYLAKDEVMVLKDIAKTMREQNPVWGI